MYLSVADSSTIAALPRQQLAMEELAMNTLGNCEQKARKTSEIPPRIAVYDFIALVKGCDTNYAGQIYKRLLAGGKVPECDEILIHANCMNHVSNHGGSNRKPIRVLFDLGREKKGNRECWTSVAPTKQKAMGDYAGHALL